MVNTELDSRLLTAADFVRKGSTAADIGCDHGKLSVHLALSGKCKHIIAVDVSEKPLQRARELVRKSGCEHLIQCRLGSGLTALLQNEADDIIIAGLSGVTIAMLLEECGWIKGGGVRLILVPATKPEVLREYLYLNGFELIAETAAVAAQRCYTVICAEYSGNKKQPTEEEIYLGCLINDSSDSAEKYKQKVLSQLKKEEKGRQSDARFTAEQKQGLSQLIKRIEAICHM